MRTSSGRLRHTFFIERNLGSKSVPEALRSAGVSVEVHQDHLPSASGDEDWIQLVGHKGWLAITKDKNIRYRTAEKNAILKAEAKVVVLRAKNCTGPKNGKVLAASRFKLDKFANRHSGPFIAGIDRSGRITKYPLE